MASPFDLSSTMDPLKFTSLSMETLSSLGFPPTLDVTLPLQNQLDLLNEAAEKIHHYRQQSWLFHSNSNSARAHGYLAMSIILSLRYSRVVLHQMAPHHQLHSAAMLYYNRTAQAYLDQVSIYSVVGPLIYMDKYLLRSVPSPPMANTTILRKPSLPLMPTPQLSSSVNPIPTLKRSSFPRLRHTSYSSQLSMQPANVLNPRPSSLPASSESTETNNDTLTTAVVVESPFLPRIPSTLTSSSSSRVIRPSAALVPGLITTAAASTMSNRSTPALTTTTTIPSTNETTPTTSTPSQVAFSRRKLKAVPSVVDMAHSRLETILAARLQPNAGPSSSPSTSSSSSSTSLRPSLPDPLPGIVRANVAAELTASRESPPTHGLLGMSQPCPRTPSGSAKGVQSLIRAFQEKEALNPDERPVVAAPRIGPQRQSLFGSSVGASPGSVVRPSGGSSISLTKPIPRPLPDKPLALNTASSAIGAARPSNNPVVPTTSASIQQECEDQKGQDDEDSADDDDDDEGSTIDLIPVPSQCSVSSWRSRRSAERASEKEGEQSRLLQSNDTSVELEEDNTAKKDENEEEGPLQFLEVASARPPTPDSPSDSDLDHDPWAFYSLSESKARPWQDKYQTLSLTQDPRMKERSTSCSPGHITNLPLQRTHSSETKSTLDPNLHSTELEELAGRTLAFQRPFVPDPELFPKRGGSQGSEGGRGGSGGGRHGKRRGLGQESRSFSQCPGPSWSSTSTYGLHSPSLSDTSSSSSSSSKRSIMDYTRRAVSGVSAAAKSLTSTSPISSAPPSLSRETMTRTLSKPFSKHARTVGTVNSPIPGTTTPSMNVQEAQFLTGFFRRNQSIRPASSDFSRQRP